MSFASDAVPVIMVLPFCSVVSMELITVCVILCFMGSASSLLLITVLVLAFTSSSLSRSLYSSNFSFRSSYSSELSFRSITCFSNFSCRSFPFLMSHSFGVSFFLPSSAVLWLLSSLVLASLFLFSDCSMSISRFASISVVVYLFSTCKMSFMTSMWPLLKLSDLLLSHILTLLSLSVFPRSL